MTLHESVLDWLSSGRRSLIGLTRPGERLMGEVQRKLAGEAKAQASIFKPTVLPPYCLLFVAESLADPVLVFRFSRPPGARAPGYWCLCSLVDSNRP